MRRLLNKFREWRRWRRCPPHVRIGYFATRTETPQVDVSVNSAGGSQGIGSWPADLQGNAHATLCARSLSHIMAVPIVDARACGDFHPDQGDPAYCECTQHKSAHLLEAL